MAGQMTTQPQATPQGKDKEENPWPERLGAWAKFAQKYLERGAQIEARYADDREAFASTQPSLLDASAKKVNMFYSNTTVIKESLYNSLPKPEVNRLHKDEVENEPARVAAAIMQRGLTYEVHCAESFDTAIKSSILDRLVPGLGILWLTFVPPAGQEPEKITVDIVYWRDFLYEPQRAWEQVMWAGRILQVSKEDARKKWGEKALSASTKEGTLPTTVAADTVIAGKVEIIQMWDKEKKEVLHLTRQGAILDRTPDPYKLRKFFPCPKPLVASPPTSKFLPIPDYFIAQDQYIEMDILYARINLIIEAVRVAGCYDASVPALGRVLSGSENKLIPVDNWALFAEKGGMQGSISWFPVEVITQVLQQLVSTYAFLKDQLFEVTGMADIIRGSSNQYETAAAQKIKAQFASVRMNGFQRDVSFFVRDALRIMGEMMTQLYSDEKMSKVCGILPPDDQQFVPAALQILRDDFLSRYSIDIEADSLTQADWGLEQQDRMEYVQSLSTFIQASVQAAEASPPLAPLMVQIIKFASIGFKGSTELEGALDSAYKQLSAMAQQQQNQPPQPSPEEAKAQQAQAESQARTEAAQQQAQIDQQKGQQELDFMQKKFAAELDFKSQMYAMELDHKQKMAAIDGQVRIEKANQQANVAAAKAAQALAEPEPAALESGEPAPDIEGPAGV